MDSIEKKKPYFQKKTTIGIVCVYGAENQLTQKTPAIYFPAHFQVGPSTIFSCILADMCGREH